MDKPRYETVDNGYDTTVEICLECRSAAVDKVIHDRDAHDLWHEGRAVVADDAAIIAKLREEHVYDNSDGFSRCHTCRVSWPCPTAETLGVKVPQRR